MKLISGAKYAALQTRYQRTARELEDAEKLAADRAVTISRLRAELDQLRDANPDSPVRQPKAPVGDAELRRRLNLALRAVAELQQRLDDMQTSHIADTRELHDLRQGVTS